MDPFFTARIATVHPGAFLVSESLVFTVRQVQSFPFAALRISLHNLCHLHPGTTALLLKEEHEVGTKTVAARSRSLQNTHETHSVLIVVLQEHNVSKADLTPRTASAVRGVGKYHACLFRRCRDRLQLMWVFKHIESCTMNEVVFFHGYLSHLISGILS